MTPSEGIKPANTTQIKFNLELKRKHSRQYPNISVNDNVKVYYTKDKLYKEIVPNWSSRKFKVEKIEESNGQIFYKISGRDKLLMRNEILLVDE